MEVSIPVFFAFRSALVGELERRAFGAGAVLRGGTAGAHLNGGEGADALGAVVMGAAGNRALDAAVGLHRVTVHDAVTSFQKLKTVCPPCGKFIHIEPREGIG